MEDGCGTEEMEPSVGRTFMWKDDGTQDLDTQLTVEGHRKKKRKRKRQEPMERKTGGNQEV